MTAMHVQDSNLLERIAQLPELQVLFAAFCGLSGTLVPLADGVQARRAGDSSKLVLIGLAGNELSGSIPPNLDALGVWSIGGGGGRVTHAIDLQDNQLEGEVPPELLDDQALPPDLFVGVRCPLLPPWCTSWAAPLLARLFMRPGAQQRVPSGMFVC